MNNKVVVILLPSVTICTATSPMHPPQMVLLPSQMVEMVLLPFAPILLYNNILYQLNFKLNTN